MKCESGKIRRTYAENVVEIRHRNLRILTFSEFFPFVFLHPPVADDVLSHYVTPHSNAEDLARLQAVNSTTRVITPSGCSSWQCVHALERCVDDRKCINMWTQIAHFMREWVLYVNETANRTTDYSMYLAFHASHGTQDVTMP